MKSIRATSKQMFCLWCRHFHMLMFFLKVGVPVVDIESRNCNTHVCALKLRVLAVDTWNATISDVDCSRNGWCSLLTIAREHAICRCVFIVPLFCNLIEVAHLKHKKSRWGIPFMTDDQLVMRSSSFLKHNMFRKKVS